MKEAKPTVVDVEASEPKAKEPLIVMLMVVILLVLLILTVVQFILFNFVEICKILGVDLALEMTFYTPLELSTFTKDRYFGSIPPLIDRAQ